jgi:hypothetical protein
MDDRNRTMLGKAVLSQGADESESAKLRRRMIDAVLIVETDE